MARSFEEVVKDINIAGWLVLNCCQFNTDIWRANVQKVEKNGSTMQYFSEYADGTTAVIALEACLFDIKQERNIRPRTLSPEKLQVIEKRHKVVASRNIESYQPLLDAFDDLIEALDYGTRSDD